MTLYDKRPTRWRDVPRHRRDVFVPMVKWVDPSPAAAVIQAGYRALRPTWDEDTEQTIFGLLRDVFRNQKGAELNAGAIVPTAAEAIADPDALVYEILDYDPDYPVYSFDDVVGYNHRVPELEALMRGSSSHPPWRVAYPRLPASSTYFGVEDVREAGRAGGGLGGTGEVESRAAPIRPGNHGG